MSVQSSARTTLSDKDRVLAVELPAVGKVRARKVTTRSRWRRTGKFSSQKCTHMPQSESPAEFAAHCLLEIDPTVESFRDQPLIITYLLDGKEHRHFPDLLVVRDQGRREIWEVKEAHDAAKPDVLARTLLMERDLTKFEYSYHLILAEELMRQPRRSNVLLILKLSRHAVDAQTREHIRQLALASGGIPWAAARDGLLGPHGYQVLCSLVTNGLLTVDLERPIGPETRFHFSESRKELIP